MSEKIEQLLENGPRAVNIGVADFADSLHRQGADVVQVTWTPPGGRRRGNGRDPRAAPLSVAARGASGGVIPGRG